VALGDGAAEAATVGAAEALGAELGDGDELGGGVELEPQPAIAIERRIATIEPRVRTGMFISLSMTLANGQVPG